MKFRYTIAELESFTDTELLRQLVTERLSTLHPYAPLAKRLKRIEVDLETQVGIESTQMESAK